MTFVDTGTSSIICTSEEQNMQKRAKVNLRQQTNSGFEEADI